MAAGYSVSSGLNPYEFHSLNQVFPSEYFGEAIPGIGYPPILPLLMGLIFRASYGLTGSLFVYNFALKLPIILANIILAYLVRHIIVQSCLDRKKSRKAWLFLLFNPFVLLTTSAWGQFDSLVAVFVVAALYSLQSRRINLTAFLLGISLSIKPLALPLAALPLFTVQKKLSKESFQYLLIFLFVVLLLCVAPFYVLGWSFQPIVSGWNAHFEVAGGISFLSFVELLQDSSTIPESLGFLGFLWVPALILSYFALGSTHEDTFQDILQRALSLMLIFYLTRAWVSEPNVNVLLPIMLVLAATDVASSRKLLHLTWIVPLVFIFLNTSFQQLFFLIYPQIPTLLADFDKTYRSLRLIGRSLVAVAWQILGCMIVLGNVRKNPIQH